MAKGVRRTTAQMIADYEAKIAALKAKASVTADHKSILALAVKVDNVATELGVSVKEVLKLVAKVAKPEVSKDDGPAAPPETATKK
ncbi:hypothetical protein [Azonexus hydrophilus]|uniref:hypothetical protein n=1 Tax=Azonexus hydrophilus TaxID=418702 RepID=UPI0012F86B75|nr:hypothetical protein [Azonexus hydrophilus]